MRILTPMYVESVPNRNSPPAILLREARREDGKTIKRTLANLSAWPSCQALPGTGPGRGHDRATIGEPLLEAGDRARLAHDDSVGGVIG